MIRSGNEGSGDGVEGEGREIVEEKRLHHATLWLPLLESIFSSLIPVVVISFFVPWQRVLLLGGLFVFLPSVVYYLGQFLTFRYTLRGQELLIRSGILFRHERRIPIERMQDFELHQGLVRRGFRLAKLKITTAGAESEEAVLDVLTLREAESLRLRMARAQRIGSTAAVAHEIAESSQTETLCELTLRDLILGGLTTNLMAALGAILGAFLYLNFFQDFGMGRIGEFEDSIVNGFRERVEEGVFFGQFAIKVLDFFFFSGSFGRALFLAIVCAFFSILGFVVRYHGFRLSMSGDVTTRTYGLLSIRRTSLTQNRIQALKLDEGLLRRWFGLASISVDSAGDRKQVDENKKRDVLVPVLARDKAEEIVRRLQPQLDQFQPKWCRLSPLAVRRGTLKGWGLLLLVILQSSVMVDPWLLVAWLPGFPLVYWLNRKWYQNTGYSVSDRYVAWQRGWINRSTLFLPVRNIQNLTVTQSPFDRRLGLASLMLDTAGQSNTGGGPVIRHLPLNEAKRCQAFLAKSVSQTRFIW